MIPTRLSVAALALAGALGAQQTFTGPISGLVFDEQAKAIREIAGVPGAAYLRSAVAVGEEGSISPDGRLAVVREGSEIVLLGLGSNSNRSVLGAASEALGEIAWSADSGSVAVESGSIQLFVNLKSAPEAARLAAFEGDAMSLAVSGRSVAAGVKGGIFLIDAEGARQIANAGDPEGLAISGSTLYVADKARKEVIAVRNFATAAEAALIANESLGLEGPVAVAVDGVALLVADSSRKLLQLSLSGELQRTIALDFDPFRLELFGRNLYRLDARRSANDSVQILQIGPEPAVYFVPAEGSLED